MTKGWSGSVLVVVLILSGVSNVGLVLKVRQLRSVLAMIKDENRLKPGQKAVSFVANSLNGEATEINFGDEPRPTVLYVFSPGCTWCDRNLSNVRAMVGQAGAKVRFIGVSLSKGTPVDYVRRHSFPMPVYFSVTDAVRAYYRLGGTPQTILISVRGTVQQSWTGAYVGETLQEIERTLAVKLPGLDGVP